MTLSPTPRSTIKRGKKRAVTERSALHEVLDAGLVCHLAVVVDGAPVVLPTGYGRDGDTLYLHGSTGARTLREAEGGVPVSVAVTLLDGIVYARSLFNHSMNYRCAVVHGTAVPVLDPETKTHALKVLTEHLSPGSWDYARQPTARELAATAVLALDLTEASVKIRSGPPGDDDEDVAESTAWAGVLPIRTSYGEPEPCPRLTGDTALPEHVSGRR
ncbi:pyridoxamine 5'-phosphate oxidase family protein [Umezawaea endophytica]|uniref:Pyridoxamine 5'-phosphate oxidase family protein n=1 Tax=Umezawaea endophytica TaxID=1654476 RepID=A0A9X2VQ99_9PSEU|nr:pyridoxamine 5'-phosphate oxidase family protein [Umezawaea endophytica]MCS7480202.1 pyridoxamine 5'-phosphate oxidase family protein [Umezawaea endophytica]